SSWLLLVNRGRRGARGMREGVRRSCQRTSERSNERRPDSGMAGQELSLHGQRVTHDVFRLADDAIEARVHGRWVLATRGRRTHGRVEAAARLLVAAPRISLGQRLVEGGGVQELGAGDVVEDTTQR